MKKLHQALYQHTMSLTALVFSLAIGFGYSGGILLAFKLLQPYVPFVPVTLYTTLSTLLFGISVITWAALQFSGMQQLFQSLLNPPSETTRIQFALNTLFPTALDILILKIKANYSERPATFTSEQEAPTWRSVVEYRVIEKLLPLTRSQITKLDMEIDAYTQSIQKRQEARSRHWLGFISYYLQYTNPKAWYQWHQHQSRKRVHKTSQALEQALLTQQGLIKIEEKPLVGKKLSPVFNTALENSAHYLHESLNQALLSSVLPSIKAKKESSDESSLLKTIYRRGAHTLITLMTYCNALFVNSVGLALYGGLSFISMLNIQALSTQYAVLSFFGIVGFTGAMSFTRPAALNASAVLFGYTQRARKGMQIPHTHQENRSYFKSAPWVQTCAALLMALGIAISQFIANTALTECWIAGSSLLELNTWIATLAANPLAASPLSILLGSLAGFCTFCLIASLLLNGTLQVEFKSKTPQRQIPSLEDNMITVMISMGFVWALTITGCLLQGQSLALLSLYTQPITLAAFGLAFVYINHRQCQERHRSFLANIFISTTVLLGAFSSTYLNSLPGSVYSLALGRSLASGLALLTGLSNLDLGLPMFRHAQGNLDALSSLLLQPRTELQRFFFSKKSTPDIAPEAAPAAA